MYFGTLFLEPYLHKKFICTYIYLKFMTISFGTFPKSLWSILFSIFVFAGYLITDRSFFTLSIYYCKGPSDQGGELPHQKFVIIDGNLLHYMIFLLLLTPQICRPPYVPVEYVQSAKTESGPKFACAINPSN